VLTFGFRQLELNKIYATHFLNNPASGKVMEKNGMVKEGELKEHIRKNGEYLSLVQYRLTQKGYQYRSEGF
jgi:RimJ/RimL family protein N-acetyltransferase